MARRSIVLALLAITLIAACGNTGAAITPGPAATGGGNRGNGTAGPAATIRDGANWLVPEPCSYLSAEEVTGIIGTDPGVPMTLEPVVGSTVSCTYLADASGALRLLFAAPGAELWQTFIDTGLNVEAVQGIGDRAIWAMSERELLFMLDDLLVFVVPDGLNSRDAEREAAITVGTIVAARMTGGAVDPGLIRTPPPVVSAQAACDLLTADEAAAVLGQGPITALDAGFTPQFCTFSVVSTSTVVLTIFLQRRDGTATWDSMVGGLTTESVSGVGDRAMFEPSTNILYVLQGDALFNVNVLTSGISGADALAEDAALAQIMLTHL